MKNKIVSFFKNTFLSEKLTFFYSAIIACLLIIVLARLIDIAYFSFIKPIYPEHLSFQLKGLVSDLIFWAWLVMLLFITQLITLNKQKPFTVIFYTLSLLLAIFITTAQLFYYEALALLDSSLFSYSFDEIVLIINTSNSWFASVSLISLYFVLGVWIYKKTRIKNHKFQLSLLIAAILLLIFIPTLKTQVINYQIAKPQSKNALNKISHFLETCTEFLLSETEPIQEPLTKATITAFHISDGTDTYKRDTLVTTDSSLEKEDNVTVEKINKWQEYPFLTDNHYNPLKNYFKPINKQPNIVFIIIEGFGYRFLNPEGEDRKLVPFLDSLRQQSLFWTKCYSTSERTFGVLPSLLGSLPYGEKGFMELDTKPNHNTLVSIANENNYASSFYYGGWTAFHKMEQFLNHQKIGYITNKYPEKYAQDSIGSAWGFPDKTVYKNALDHINTTSKPRLDVFLTLSTHGPFNFQGIDTYKNTVQEIAKSFKDQSLANQVNASKELFATVNYADQSVKFLFQELKKRPDYNNTIFIITGDHVLHEGGYSTALEMYHVPLVIYSPLLKTAATFKGITSHLDVPSSLINLLSHKNLLKTPEMNHWIGDGLNVSKTFNATRFIPFMQNSREINECLYNNYYLNNNHLFKVSSNNELTETKDAKMLKKVKNELAKFKSLNDYVCANDRLLPLEFLASLNGNNKIQKDTFSLKEKLIIHKGENKLTSFILKSTPDELLFDFSNNIVGLHKNDEYYFKVDFYQGSEHIDYFNIKSTSIEQLKKTDKVNLSSVDFIRNIENKNSLFKKGMDITVSIYTSKPQVIVSDLKINIYHINH